MDVIRSFDKLRMTNTLGILEYWNLELETLNIEF